MTKFSAFFCFVISKLSDDYKVSFNEPNCAHKGKENQWTKKQANLKVGKFHTKVLCNGYKCMHGTVLNW